MIPSLKNYLRETDKNFERAYNKAKTYVREEIDPYIDSLEFSINTRCNVAFPITEDNLYVLGLDTERLTINIFFDEYLADA